MPGVGGFDENELGRNSDALSVSLIPEGLPALITITLAIGVQRMAPAQRHHPAAACGRDAGLGVAHLLRQDGHADADGDDGDAVTAESAYEITGDGYAPEGEVKRNRRPAGEAPVLALMGRVPMLCNDAELFQEEGAWRVEGDRTEGALYPFATKLGLNRQAELAAAPRIDAIPFESEHKFMATLHKTPDGAELLLVKGAPEVILEHCDRQQLAGGQPAPLDRERFMQESDRLAAQGERVLGLAWLENPGVKAGSLGPADLPNLAALPPGAPDYRVAVRLYRGPCRLSHRIIIAT